MKTWLITGCSSGLGRARLRALMEQGGVSLPLASCGPCPAREYVEKSPAKEDYGEFSPGEMYDIIAARYA